MTITSVRYVVCDKDRELFFTREHGNGPVTTSVETATKFWDKKEAEIWQRSAFSDYQKSICTEIVPVKITFEFQGE